MLVQAPSAPYPKKLSAQYSMKAGSVSFETETVTPLYDWTISSIYSVQTDICRDITCLLDFRTGSSTAVFGNDPQAGNTICLILDGELPADGILRFWVETARDAKRNPFPENADTIFGHTRWQIFTADGWRDTDFTDETHGFLISGAVTVDLGESVCVPCTEFDESGFALRCVLISGSYDHPPRAVGIAGNLFPVSQRETLSCCFTFDGSEEIVIESEVAAQGAVFVYCREHGEQLYSEYREYSGIDKKGRFYTMEQIESGVVIHFDQQRFGYCPECEKDAVKVVCYKDDMLHHRGLGTVFGYDDQIIDIDFVSDILPESFSLIAEIPDQYGGSSFKFISPGPNPNGEISYELLSHEGAIKITDPGVGTEYRLFICDCAVTLGEKGVIRKNSILTHKEGQPGMERITRFISPAPAVGGSSWENPDRLRRRFADSMKQINTAVTADDYKFLAQNTPALCIHKVNAWGNTAQNTVWITVKPQSGADMLPKLSPAYQNAILEHLNRCRMITTRIELLQPRYLPIDVIVALRVKKYYRSVEKDVYTLLCNMLDHVTSDDDFGGIIRFDEMYRELSHIAGVTAIDSLRLIPAESGCAVISGNDILLPPDTLCYPGDIKTELRDEISKHR